MTVEQLIEVLKDLPAGMEVFLSSDAEGNSFSPLDDSGELYYSIDHDEMHNLDEVEDIDVTDLRVSKVLVLWPV